MKPKVTKERCCAFRVPAWAISSLTPESRRNPRRRFTLAHEIGHHVLPGLQELSIPCLEGRIDNWQRTLDPAERAANRFAAEILMPREAIREWIESDPSMEAIQTIAAACETSLTSSAVRLMSLTAYTAAVVWVAGGKSTLVQAIKRTRALGSEGAAPRGYTDCALDAQRIGAEEAKNGASGGLVLRNGP